MNGTSNLASTMKVNFIIPLSGRVETFRRFVENFEMSFLRHKENVSLFVILYKDQRKEQHSDIFLINNLVQNLKKNYPEYKILLIQKFGSFHRGVALQEASEYFWSDDLLFFVDVDCVLSRDILLRIRQNTIQGRQIYFPVMFSEYNPEFVKTDERDLEFITYERGFWRYSSYGQVSIYKSDFDEVHGYDTHLRGWGLEDLDFLDRVVRKNLTVFRAPDLGLIHKFHPIICDPHLPVQNYEMCKGTVWSTMGSSSVLSEWIHNNRSHQNY